MDEIRKPCATFEFDWTTADVLSIRTNAQNDEESAFIGNAVKRHMRVENKMTSPYETIKSWLRKKASCWIG